jgi:hypothetical protein
VHVVMTYSHEFAGVHKLPVIFKLKNGSTRAGRKIQLNECHMMTTNHLIARQRNNYQLCRLYCSGPAKIHPFPFNQTHI